MRTNRAPFQPLGTDIDDDKIERLAREKGVGVFVKPSAKEPPARGQESQVAVAAAPDPSTKESAVESDQRCHMKSLNLQLPDYAWTDLKIRAAQRQTSLRHVVMMALINDGITIADEDLIEDGRRIRGDRRV